MMTGDPYDAMRRRRFGMTMPGASPVGGQMGGYPSSPYGNRYGGGYGYGVPPGASGYHPTQPAPIPRMNTSDATAQDRAGGAAAAAATQRQSQQAGAQLNAFKSASTAQGAQQQAASVDAYRRTRDSGIGRDNLNTSAQQRQMATAVGADPSADATDIAAAASGPYTTGADGRIAGADTGNQSVSPASPADVRNAALNIQAQKDGAQRTAFDSSYAQGRTGTSSSTDPFDASTTPNAPQPPPAGTTVADAEAPDTTEPATGSPAAPVVYNPGKAVRKKPAAAMTPPTS